MVSTITRPASSLELLLGWLPAHPIPASAAGSGKVNPRDRSARRTYPWDVVGEGASASDVFEFLDGAEFPASREGLAALARANGAPQQVIAALEMLDDADFDTAAGLKDALVR
jgi:hypothetical protein